MQRLGHHRVHAALSVIRLADRELSAAVSLPQMLHHFSGTALVSDAAIVQQYQQRLFLCCRRHQLYLALRQHMLSETLYTVPSSQDLHRCFSSIMPQSPSYAARLRDYSKGTLQPATFPWNVQSQDIMCSSYIKSLGFDAVGTNQDNCRPFSIWLMA